MRGFIGLAFITLALLPTAHAAPLEAYARLPLYENVALSPDGTKAAFVTTVGDEREIVIQPLTQIVDGSGISRIKAGRQKLRDLNWLGDEQLLITISQSTDYFTGEQSEQFALSNFDLKRKAVFSPMTWAEETWDLLSANPVTRIIDGKPIVFIESFATPRADDSWAIQALYKADLRDQTTRVIDASPSADPRRSYSWAIDGYGNVMAQSVYDEGTKYWTLAINQSGRWVEVQSEMSMIETPSIIGLGPEEDTLIVRKKELRGWTLKSLSLKDGNWTGDDPEEKCCGVSFLKDQKTNRLIGYSWMDSRLHYNFFEEKLQHGWNQVVQSFPGEELQIESFSADMKKIVVRVFGKRTGAAYVVVDIGAKQITQAGNLYSGIEAKDIAAVKPVTYDAADGMKIGAYLTLPNEKPPKQLPLIVMPHGGPAARDELGFDWFAQALASQGYLVLQANFRGSWGLGAKLQEAGYGEYGRKMQTDLSDGAKALIKLGIADPQRICIVGASYGGYAALNGAAIEPDMYRCAVSIAGISDLKKNLEGFTDARISKDSSNLRYMLRYIGATDVKDPVIAERSPAKHANQVKAPILLIHGDNDSVVPFEQSQIMANALKKAGKQYEFVKLKSEDHWLSKADTRLQTLQSVVKFLETHNPP